VVLKITCLHPEECPTPGRHDREDSTYHIILRGLMASPGHTPVHTRRGYYCSATRPRGSTVEHEVHLSPAARAARGLIHKVSTPLRFDATMAQPVGIGRKSVIRSPLPTTAPPGNPDVSKTDRNVDQEHFIERPPIQVIDLRVHDLDTEITQATSGLPKRPPPPRTPRELSP
jgi:hypothetical protein